MGYGTNGFAFPEPIQLRKEVKKLEKRGMRKIINQEVNITDLEDKAQRIWHGNAETFSARELKNLPFILSSKQDASFISFVLSKLPLNRVIVFQRLFRQYIKTYTPESDLTKCIRAYLVEVIQKNSMLKRTISWLVEVPDAIERGPIVLRSVFKHGIIADLQELGVPDGLHHSRFICYGIVEAFHMNGWTVDDALNILQEVSKKYNQSMLEMPNGKSYRLIAILATDIIIKIQKEGNRDVQRRLVQALVSRTALGSPRFRTLPSGELICDNTSWNLVSKEALQIFKNWWNQDNLDFFFEIIEESIQNNSDADRMWKYRQKFWNAYVSEMINTRVILGSKAQELIRKREKGRMQGNERPLEYARLDGGQGQSLLLFTLGQYTFIEVSHNGKLRIFDNEDSPIPVIETEKRSAPYPYSKVQYSKPDKEFIHSSPRTYSWQKNVRAWIKDNCEIYTASDEWEL